jgi:2-dehydro-3-deoxy-D-arabinonate dehydratase
MKIGQIVIGNEKKVAILSASGLFALKSISNVKELIIKCNRKTLTEYIAQLNINKQLVKIGDNEDSIIDKGYRLERPVDIPEAWAVGVTYKRQASEHDKDLRTKKGKTDDIYQYVYHNERAEVFFKGFSRSIVGSGEDLWLRGDSSLVMPEAELVLVIGNDGLPVGYTLGNDLTAWDIESECPLYLNQAKIWSGSGSIGPWIIPIEDDVSPYTFNLRCQVIRNNKVELDVSGSTSELKRSVEELCYFMNYSNEVPAGSVLFTGTTCVIDHDFGLIENDLIKISTPKIGCLENGIKKHEYIKKDYPKR